MESLARRLGLLGRSRRTAIFNFLILCLVGAVVLWFVGLSEFRRQVHAGEGAMRPMALFPAWVSYVQLALDLVFLWLMVRRFHDQDRPGWLALVPSALVTAMWYGLPLPPSVALLIFLGFLVALFLPGTIGPNRSGPDPRGWTSVEHYHQQQEALRRP